MIFVNMQDKFLSGWGEAAGGRSLLCVKCRTREQADAIAEAASNRPEMKYITMANSPRRTAPGDHIKVVDFDDLGAVWKKYYTG